MNQIIRYVIPTILIAVGMIMFGVTNVKFSNVKSIGNDYRGVESVVLSHCSNSFEDNPSAYLSCVGSNLKVEEINSVIVGEIRTASIESEELVYAIKATTGISIEDIKKHGILGGENSEIRKIKNELFEPGKADCLQLGVSTESKDCGLYEELLTNLRQSSFFYNKPSIMTVGEVVEIDLALNPANPEEAKSQLRDLKGTITEGKGKIARHMSAELFGASFEVNPSGPQKRVILDSNTTKWKWKVKPLKEGTEELLTLDVYVHLEVDGKASPPITIKTYREKILVEVTSWDSIKNRVSEWSPVIALVLTVIGAIWGAYSWLRGKKWKVDDEGK